MMDSFFALTIEAGTIPRTPMMKLVFDARDKVTRQVNSVKIISYRGLKLQALHHIHVHFVSLEMSYYFSYRKNTIEGNHLFLEYAIEGIQTDEDMS
jgi:hypothetical protein